jgi:hypothetical protein
MSTATALVILRIKNWSYDEGDGSRVRVINIWPLRYKKLDLSTGAKSDRCSMDFYLSRRCCRESKVYRCRLSRVASVEVPKLR